MYKYYCKNKIACGDPLSSLRRRDPYPMGKDQAISHLHTATFNFTLQDD